MIFLEQFLAGIVVSLAIFALILHSPSTRDLFIFAFEQVCAGISEKYKRANRFIFKRYHDEVDAIEAIAKQGEE